MNTWTAQRHFRRYFQKRERFLFKRGETAALPSAYPQAKQASRFTLLRPHHALRSFAMWLFRVNSSF